MLRRLYLWCWPLLGLVLVAWLVQHSLVLWHFLLPRVPVLAPYDPRFMAIWGKLTPLLWHAVWLALIALVIWYGWDWVRGFALLDVFALALRRFLLRSTVGNTDQTLDTASQHRANRAIKSVKMRYQWRSPHSVTVSVRLPTDQLTAKIVRERVVGGLGDDGLSAISWLDRVRWWPLKERHWELDQSKPRWLKITGLKD